MSFFKTFGSIAVILNAILVAYFALAGTTISIINLELAALGSIGILSATYFGYKQMIEKKLAQEDDSEVEIKNETETEEDDEDEDDPALTKMSLVTQSYKGYLFPLRLVTYAIFAGSFIYLSTSGSLEIAAFFVGLGIAPISILIAMFWIKRGADKQ